MTAPELNFVSYTVAAITGDPDCFEIAKTVDERGVLLSLSVDEAHMGRVLGRNGETARGLRSLLKALGMANNAWYSLRIEKRS